eukprot:gene10620-3243_t
MMQTEVSSEDDPSRSLAVSKKYLQKIPSRTRRRSCPCVISQHLEEFDDHYVLQVEFSTKQHSQQFIYEQNAGKIFIKKQDNSERKQLMLPEDVDVGLLTAGIYEGVYKFNLPKRTQ